MCHPFQHYAATMRPILVRRYLSLRNRRLQPILICLPVRYLPARTGWRQFTAQDMRDPLTPEHQLDTLFTIRRTLPGGIQLTQLNGPSCSFASFKPRHNRVISCQNGLARVDLEEARANGKCRWTIARRSSLRGHMLQLQPSETRSSSTIFWTYAFFSIRNRPRLLSSPERIR